MWAHRLLMLLPSYPERSSRRWWVAQDMVSVTRTGLRMASSAADAAADIAGDTAPEENGVINSSQVGWSRVRLLKQRWPTTNLRHISDAGKRAAADLQQTPRRAGCVHPLSRRPGFPGLNPGRTGSGARCRQWPPATPWAASSGNWRMGRLQT